MAPHDPLLGYCRQCQANVQHVRSVRRRLSRWVDSIAGGLLRWVGVGPWYCVSCARRSLLFTPPRKDVGTYNPRSNKIASAGSDDCERVGNFLETDISIVTRSVRNRQFSEKYRREIVESLLDGSASFSQLRSQLEISELDLQAWIAGYHQSRLREVLEGAATEFDDALTIDAGQVSRGDPGDRAGDGPVPR